VLIRISQDNQRRLASLSPQGRPAIANQSAHFAQNNEPEWVIQTIREVVNKAHGK